MALPLADKIKPKNNGAFALVDAEDVEMPDGSRLSEQTKALPVLDGVAEIRPENFYVFGEVSTLAVSLAEVNDGRAHEYCFEFTAAGGFDALTITPEPKWVSEPDIEPGKTYQVSILRGLGVIVGA